MAAERFDRQAAERFLERLWNIDAALVGKGFPAMSPVWRETVADATYACAEHGIRQFVVRKGRRVGASRIVAPRLWVAEALFGSYHVPPGEEIAGLFISVKRSEAATRIRNITGTLDALGIGYGKLGDGDPNAIILDQKPVVARVVTASFKTAVGDNAMMVWDDEVTRQNDGGANPAEELVASVKPTLATNPNAKLWLVSSPLGAHDFHARTFDLGNTDAQRVYSFPTWVGNPTLTEADTRKLEPDERIWAREYAAVPQAAALSAFPEPDITAAEDLHRAPCHHLGPYFMVSDPSGGANDTWSWAVMSWVSEPPERTPSDGTIFERRVPYTTTVYVDGEPRAGTSIRVETWQTLPDGTTVRYQPAKTPKRYLRIHEIDGIGGDLAGQGMTSSSVVARIAKCARRYRCRKVHTDNYAGFAFQSDFRGQGLEQVQHSMSTMKSDAATRVRLWLHQRSLAIPKGHRIAQDLREFEERIDSNGRLKFVSPRVRGHHGDYATLLIVAAAAELERDQYGPGSPFAPAWGKTEVIP